MTPTAPPDLAQQVADLRVKLDATTAALAYVRAQVEHLKVRVNVLELIDVNDANDGK